jgi:hypothetical protein
MTRLFRGFERRDGVVYLHKSGGPTSPLKVCVEDLHLLDPWEPSTVAKLRADLDALASEHSRLKRRFKTVEDFAEQASTYLKTVSKQLALIDPQLASKNVH